MTFGDERNTDTEAIAPERKPAGGERPHELGFDGLVHQFRIAADRSD